MKTVGGTVFVGRQREMAQLTSALSLLLGGNGSVATVSGEAGMGKSSLVEHFAAKAADEGVQVYWGRCREQAGMPALWPWTQVFRSIGAGDAALFQNTGERGDLDPENFSPAARFRMFDSAATLLKEKSSENPLVVVFDNLHWADSTTLGLLEYAAPELQDFPVLIVGTYRESEVRRNSPLSSALAEVARQRSSFAVRMSGFTKDDITSVLRGEGQFEPSETLIQAVFTHSEGSPFFAQNAIRLLKANSELTEQKDDWEIGMPAGVQDVVRKRLETLDAECFNALTRAAVIGREFDLSVLVAVSDGTNDDALLDLMDEALASGIITEVEDSPDRLRFAHELFRQVLLTELSLSRRVRLHARIAEVLMARSSKQTEPVIAALAHHYSQAESVTGPDKALEYLRLAGQSAMSRYAFDDACSWFRQAVSLVDKTESGTAADAWYQLATAEFGTGRLIEAREAFGQAFDIYKREKDLAGIFAVASFPYTDPHNYRAIFDRALRLLPSASREHALVLTRSAVLESDEERKSERFERSLAIAKELKDRQLETWALGRRAVAEWQGSQFSRSLDTSRLAVDASAECGDIHAEVNALFWFGFIRLTAGMLTEAVGPLDRALYMAVEAKSVPRQIQILNGLEKCSALSGDFDQAIAYGKQLIDLASSRDIDLLFALEQLASINYERGEADAGDMWWHRRNQVIKIVSVERPIKSDIVEFLYLRRSPHYTPDGIDEDLMWPYIDRLSPGLKNVAVFLTAELAATRRDPELAERLLGLFPVNRDPKGLFYPAATGLSVNRAHAEVLTLVARHEEASEKFEMALNQCRNGGYLPELAYTSFGYARSLIESKSRDSARVDELIDEGLKVSRKLGMKPLESDLVELQQHLASGSRNRYPDGLTERETEVLELVAAGLSNRQISERLFISQNTVIRHVSNIFSKTGCSNRVEATTYFERSGLQQQAR